MVCFRFSSKSSSKEFMLYDIVFVSIIELICWVSVVLIVNCFGSKVLVVMRSSSGLVSCMCEKGEVGLGDEEVMFYFEIFILM